MQNNYLSLANDSFREHLELLYGTETDVLNQELARYQHLEKQFFKNFPDTSKELQFFSAPGRSEIAGNHTDHQLGKVITTSVNMDIIAACTKRDDNKVKLISEGYRAFPEVDLNNLAVQKNEASRTTALIRGVAQGFVKHGYNIGGFNCYVTSNVPSGSGLSSSAAFEILLTTIFNYYFNNAEVASVEQAKIGQFAENVYFGKPSGLLDQCGCSTGGVIAIDFKEKENPHIKKLNLNLADYGYAMVITRTDSGHANLTDEYAAIPHEMGQIAQHFGQDVLSKVEAQVFFAHIPELKEKYSDRAILRALHFFTEEERTSQQIKALENHDFTTFLDLVNASGLSSELQLQNVLIPGNSNEQEGALALALTREFIQKHAKKGACRIHGGGFGGTIQAYLRLEDVNEYIEYMESIFGQNACRIIRIRPVGGIEV